MTRRRFLAAGATALGAAAAAACSQGSSPTAPASNQSTARASQSPDAALLHAALADMSGLLATVRATIHTHPGLGDMVQPLTRVVSQQVGVLESVNPTARHSPSVSSHGIPHDAERALKSLRHQTWKAAFDRLDDTLAAESGPFARVLSAISAGLNEQVVRLGGPARLAAVPSPSTIGSHEARRLQPTLAAENAAIYAYGVIGARGDDQTASKARLGYDVHLGRRDVLTSMIQASGVDPAAALPGYRLPHRISGNASVARFARRIELRCCEVYAHAVSETVADARRFCAAAQTNCGSWSVAWGQAPQPFPGAPEL